MSGERILVIEDDDDIREVMQDVLASEGFRVDVARDGLDALRMLEHEAPPPLILLDMMMPRMDGETFLRVLRGRPALADATVVVISGNAATREKAEQLHAAACLVKPFELDELLGLVRSLTSAEPGLGAER
jgi:CheY-like chemotaxis protein